MKVFLAGATGAMGTALVPQLVAQGKRLRRISRRLARLVAGEAATLMMTEVRGASERPPQREIGRTTTDEASVVEPRVPGGSARDQGQAGAGSWKSMKL